MDSETDLGGLQNIFVKNVIPRRLGDTAQNLIICGENVNIAKISRQLFEDVKNSGRVFYPKPNEMYAHRFGRNRIWYRAMVKFWRDSKCVLHLVDKSGVHDLNESIEIRRIQSQHCIAQPLVKISMPNHSANADADDDPMTPIDAHLLQPAHRSRSASPAISTNRQME